MMSGKIEAAAVTIKRARGEYVFDGASFTGWLLRGCVDDEWYHVLVVRRRLTTSSCEVPRF
jgi:hypothetical protein